MHTDQIFVEYLKLLKTMTRYCFLSVLTIMLGARLHLAWSIKHVLY